MGYVVLLYRIQYKHHNRDCCAVFEHTESAARELSRSLAKDSAVSNITVHSALVDIPSTTDWRPL